jgi:iduronate 2-sulfatase
MIKVPGLTDDGVRVEKPVEFVDIFPTLVELADFPHLEVCPQLSNETELCTEGSSLVPLLSDPSYDLWKSAVFWQYPRPMGCYIENHVPCSMGYSVLSGKYRYTEYVKIINLGVNNYAPDWESMIDHEELYDQELDPQENRNR